MAGLDTLVESVYHPMFRDFDSESGDVLERADAGAPEDEIVRDSSGVAFQILVDKKCPHEHPLVVYIVINQFLDVV